MENQREYITHLEESIEELKKVSDAPITPATVIQNNSGLYDN